MEVQICVPTGTDISIIEQEYSDIYQDAEDLDGEDIYFVGDCMDADEDNGSAWLTRDAAIECCGFVEGSVPSAETLIEGNGAWAQGKARKSELFIAAYERGKLAALR